VAVVSCSAPQAPVTNTHGLTAVTIGSQVLRERQEGPAAPLKKFHNEIKRRLIYR
jgi:hypothetical protein